MFVFFCFLPVRKKKKGFKSIFPKGIIFHYIFIHTWKAAPIMKTSFLTYQLHRVTELKAHCTLLPVDQHHATLKQCIDMDLFRFLSVPAMCNHFIIIDMSLFLHVSLIKMYSTWANGFCFYQDIMRTGISAYSPSAPGAETNTPFYYHLTET